MCLGNYFSTKNVLQIIFIIKGIRNDLYNKNSKEMIYTQKNALEMILQQKCFRNDFCYKNALAMIFTTKNAFEFIFTTKTSLGMNNF